MTFWAETLARFDPAWLPEIRAMRLECEARRATCAYNPQPGTVSEAACVVLRALCERYRPTEVIEIGTFIGTSTLAMLGCDAVARIYTCDKRNACGPDDPRIKRYPLTASSTMLRQLVARGVIADFWFLDGRLEAPDIDLVRALSSPETVFAFDDYHGQEKGVLNVRAVLSRLSPGYSLHVPPRWVLGLDSDTTIAVLAP